MFDGFLDDLKRMNKRQVKKINLAFVDFSYFKHIQYGI